MRNFVLSLLLVVLVVGCRNGGKEEDNLKGSGNSLFELSFRDYEEIEMFRNFEKVSDTSIESGTGVNQYRLLEVRNNSDNIVVFYKKAEQDNIEPDELEYKVVDTIHIRNLEGNEKITIGYCYKEGIRDGEIIAVVEDTDSLHIRTIEAAWRADPDSGKIGVLPDFFGINCINEEFESEPAQISLNE